MVTEFDIRNQKIAEHHNEALIHLTEAIQLLTKSILNSVDAKLKLRDE